MSETTDAVAGHAPNLFARWIVDGFPRFQVSCECGWKTAAEDSEQAATASHAEHARQPIGSPTWNPMSQRFDRPPTLTEFLLARIGEDEVEARAVMASAEVGVDLEPLALSWEHDRDYGPTGYLCINPSRVLAECEAKRVIVDLHRSGGEWSYGPGAACSECGDAMPSPCATLLAMARPYASHPDYRPEWKP